MIYSPATDLPKEYVGKLQQYSWMGIDIEHPFLRAAQQILHLPSCNQSFMGKNLFWAGLSEEQIEQFVNTPHDKLSFDSLMQNRAEELAVTARALNLPVYVLWSGGIDSTAAVLACENNGMDYTVIATPLAQEEYPRMFEDLQRMGKLELFSHIGFYDTMYDYYTKGIVVTGFCGDQLGSSTIGMCYGGDVDQAIRTSWKMFIMRNHPDGYDGMHKLVKASGLKIQNSFELGWLLNITLKWDFVTYNAPFWSAACKGVGARLPLSHSFPFFSSMDFRLFAIDYFREHGIFYKEQTRPFAKKYILNNTGDQAYFRNKKKEATMFVVRPYGGYVEDDHVVVTFA